MTNSFDEQLRRVFDALSDQVRATFDAHRDAAVQQLVAAQADAERAAIDSAVQEAAATAEREVSTRLQLDFARREVDIREQARQGGYNEGVADARAEALAIQEAHEAVAQASAAAAAQAAAEHAAQLARHASASTDVVQQARAAQERLLSAVRALDATSSLSQTLDALTAAAQTETACVAMFLVRGDVLRVWAHSGFDTLDAAPADVSLDAAGLAAEAVRTGASQRTSSAHERPAFAGAPDSGAFVAVPLSMNGQVIAVLCGDDAACMDAGASLASTYEVLARHAARVLESLTALRLAQLGTPAAAASAS